ncbi:MAG TPA: DUF4349 domain-containing protein [Anaerolineae bacterium]
MMTWKKILSLLMLLSLVFVACASRASEPAAESAAPPFAGDAAGEAAEFEAPMEEPAVEVERVVSDVAFNAQDVPQERLIIRTGELSLVVEDTEEAIATIGRMAEENGGWVVSSNVFQLNENAKRGDITIRVPATGFNSTIEALKGLAVEVTSESTSGQDVTEEYVDLSARLENLEATADRVRSFLDEARDVEDALAVNQELSRLEGEIEVIKGRLQYLSQSAAFSTITVQLTPDVLAQPIEVGGWRPQGVARDAIEALIETLQIIASALIWLAIYVLPIALIILVPLWLLFRFVSRRRRPTAAATGE